MTHNAQKKVPIVLINHSAADNSRPNGRKIFWYQHIFSSGGWQINVDDNILHPSCRISLYSLCLDRLAIYPMGSYSRIIFVLRSTKKKKVDIMEKITFFRKKKIIISKSTTVNYSLPLSAIFRNARNLWIVVGSALWTRLKYLNNVGLTVIKMLKQTVIVLRGWILLTLVMTWYWWILKKSGRSI